MAYNCLLNPCGENEGGNYSKLLHTMTGFWHVLFHTYSGAKKVFSQPPIVQVLPLKKMREACNFHHRYTSTMREKSIKITL